MYKIQISQQGHWIYISGEGSFYESDEFVTLVKEYQSQIGGAIVAVSDDVEYAIANDPLKLNFQWDSALVLQ